MQHLHEVGHRDDGDHDVDGADGLHVHGHRHNDSIASRHVHGSFQHEHHGYDDDAVHQHLRHGFDERHEHLRHNGHHRHHRHDGHHCIDPALDEHRLDLWHYELDSTVYEHRLDLRLELDAAVAVHPDGHRLDLRLHHEPEFLEHVHAAEHQHQHRQHLRHEQRNRHQLGRRDRVDHAVVYSVDLFDRHDDDS